MSMKKVTVHADPEDLALIKDAAVRRGIPEADIIREGIHLAAMGVRVRNERLDWPVFDGGGKPVTPGEVTAAVSGELPDDR